MTSIDNALKAKLNSYNLVKGSLTQMQRKRTWANAFSTSTGLHISIQRKLINTLLGGCRLERGLCPGLWISGNSFGSRTKVSPISFQRRIYWSKQKEPREGLECWIWTINSDGGSSDISVCAIIFFSSCARTVTDDSDHKSDRSRWRFRLVLRDHFQKSAWCLHPKMSGEQASVPHFLLWPMCWMETNPIFRFIVREFVYSQDEAAKQQRELEIAAATEKELWVTPLI